MTKALTGLLANTAYYFKVYSQAGCYAVSSATITSSTFYTGIIPGTPTSLTLTAIGTTTATLNWAAGRCCSQQGALRISDKQIFDRDMPCKFSIVSNEKKC